MSTFGNVVKSFVLYNHKDGSSRGFGFVEFSEISSAEKAASQGKILISGKYATIERAVAKTDLSGTTAQKDDTRQNHPPKIQKKQPFNHRHQSHAKTVATQNQAAFPAEFGCPHRLSEELNSSSSQLVGNPVHPRAEKPNCWPESMSSNNLDDFECATCGSQKASPTVYQSDNITSARCNHVSHRSSIEVKESPNRKDLVHSSEHDFKSSSVQEQSSTGQASPDLSLPHHRAVVLIQDIPLWSLSFQEHLKAKRMAADGREQLHHLPELRFNFPSRSQASPTPHSCD